jgi:DNA helicase-2/ATP-dependent DNA helicase PcrA
MSTPTDFRSELNESQYEAVTYLDGPSLVIAGAGSGKTRVLTYKIAYLLQHGIHPWNILALTFTNKAAREMNLRISQICQDISLSGMWSGTFHSIFARLLRIEHEVINYPQDFTIYDSADTKSLIKAITKELGLDEKVYKQNIVAGHISEAKNHLILPAQYAAESTIISRDRSEGVAQIHKIYTIYQQRLSAAGAMDFDDLLLNTYLLLRDHSDVRQRYIERFQYILVDEYQDTNMAQYQILSLLTNPQSRICVVGDDAQSIYSFRGADISNILNFQQQYPNARIIKLECNYRSTQNIVNAANSIIRYNEHQIPKTVYSAGSEGDPITLFSAASDKEEARKIVANITRLHARKDVPYNEVAVLYRTNAQSRVIEEALQGANVPYRIYGGLSFYQRKEIKDTLAYCRLIANPHDEESFRRIINYPARGIGATTIQKVQLAAATHDVSMWAVANDPLAYGVEINKGAINKLSAFCELIESFRVQLDKVTASDLVRDIIRRSGIGVDLTLVKSAENTARQENVDELLASIQTLEKEARDEDGRTRVSLTEYLSTVSLLSDADTRDDGTPRVTLMTIHAAKGLEFQAVFVTGMEEDLFPSSLAKMSTHEMEEERRLFYVAVTRAKEYCFLSYAQTRFRYGSLQFAEPSPFLDEIDEAYIQRQDTASSAPSFSSNAQQSKWGSGRYGANSSAASYGGGRQTKRYSATRNNDFDSFFGGQSEDDFRSSMGYNNSQSAYNEYSGTTAKGDTDYEAGYQGYGELRSRHSSAKHNYTKKVPTSPSHITTSPLPYGYVSTGVVRKKGADTTADAATQAAWPEGAVVRHNRFGVGKVVSVEGSGDNAKVRVEFDQVGIKNLLLKFAGLKRL